MPWPKQDKYTEEQCSAPALTLDEAKQFIADNKWTFAKSMPLVPHEYVVRRNVDNDKFIGFVKLVRAEGEIRPWGRYRHTYLDIDGWCYWTMGAPLVVTIILNRAKLNEEGKTAPPPPPPPKAPPSKRSQSTSTSTKRSRKRRRKLSITLTSRK